MSVNYCSYGFFRGVALYRLEDGESIFWEKENRLIYILLKVILTFITLVELRISKRDLKAILILN
jgi:hypothetical protein